MMLPSAARDILAALRLSSPAAQPDMLAVFERLHKTGAAVTVRVAGQVSAGKYLISMAGYRFLAESGLALTLGQLLRVHIRQVRAGIRLQLAGDEGVERAENIPLEDLLPEQMDKTAIIYLGLNGPRAMDELRVLYHPKKQDDQDGQQISTLSLVIENEHTARTEIRFLKQGENLAIHFFVDDPEWMAMLQEDFDQLRRELHTAIPDVKPALSMLLHAPEHSAPSIQNVTSRLDIQI